jgi:hypothetical protein
MYEHSTNCVTTAAVTQADSGRLMRAKPVDVRERGPSYVCPFRILSKPSIKPCYIARRDSRPLPRYESKDQTMCYQLSLATMWVLLCRPFLVTMLSWRYKISESSWTTHELFAHPACVLPDKFKLYVTLVRAAEMACHC